MREIVLHLLILCLVFGSHQWVAGNLYLSSVTEMLFFICLSRIIHFLHWNVKMPFVLGLFKIFLTLMFVSHRNWIENTVVITDTMICVTALWFVFAKRN